MDQLILEKWMDMKGYLIFFILIVLCSSRVHALDDAVSIANSVNKQEYDLKGDPIDVVIPCASKDLETLELCIEGIKKNCRRVRRVIVVSAKPLTKKAEWFDEADFPFSKKNVAFYLNKKNEKETQVFLNNSRSRAGWYLQQLIKLYAAFVIPEISSNILVLDSDTIFLKPVKFLNAQNGGLYNVGSEHHIPYFIHASKLIPKFKKIFKNYSGICHHMLFQRAVLEDLFATVEKVHRKPFWQAFCLSVNSEELRHSGASEFEIYFNYVFARTNQVQLRKLKWAQTTKYEEIEKYALQNCDYVSRHVRY